MPETAYGTLIGAYGNGKGIVVVTDSMLASKDPNGNLHPMPQIPGQKLLRLDDYTVCALAGLHKKAVRVAPTLNTDILGIINSYNQQGHDRIPMESTLNNIAKILQFYLENVANMEIETNQPTDLLDFTVELLLAGYDLDGKPKIGSLVIEVRQPPIQIPLRVPPRAQAAVTEHDLTIVGTSFSEKTHGIDDTAKAILHHPSYFTRSTSSILKNYARAKLRKGDDGSSLSIDDMEQLGKTLIEATSLFNTLVGGDPQVAVFENGKLKNVEQQAFRPLVSPFRLAVLRNVSFYGGAWRSFDLLGLGGGRQTVFFDHVVFLDEKEPDLSFRPIPLDNNIFIGCRFVNQILSYDGGPFFLDDSDIWDNVEIYVTPNGLNNLAIARRLHEKAVASKH